MRRHILGEGRWAAILPVLVVLAAVAGLVLSRCGSQKQVKPVLLISIDTCRADHLSCYGFDLLTTPNIDKLAAKSIVFTNAVSPAPITLPAHASMMTGVIPPYHGVRDNMDCRLDETQVTLAEILKRADFKTAAIVSSFVLDAQFGLDQGFDYYNDSFINVRNAVGFNERRADETTELAVKWLDENADGKFFLFLHYFDPHVSYDPPAPFATQFQDDLYAGEIAYTDHCIGAVINKLKQLGLYDSSVIVITADHGEMLGEHGEQTHAYFVYQSAVRIPLILKAPGVPPARVNDLVGLIDILPTICGVLDLDPPASVQGNDLSTYFGASQLLAERNLYCESLVPTKYDAAALHGVVNNRWKYIHTTRPELYDLGRDPLETNDLAGQSVAKVAAFRQHLTTMLGETTTRDSRQANTELDEQSLQRIESLGYVRGQVSDDFQLNPAKPDPKDVITFYEAWRLLQALPQPPANSESASPAVLQQYEKEKQISQGLLREQPNFFGAHLYAGKLAMLQGDFPAAAARLGQAVSLKPEQFETLSLLGVTLVRLGQLDQARQYFEQAVLLRPHDPMVQLNLGMILAKLGDLEKAIGHFRHAIAIDSKVPELHKNMGRALFLQGDFKQAVDHYRQSLQLNPDQPEIYNMLAEAHFRQDNIAAAAADLTAGLRLRPDWPTALNNLARIKATAVDPSLRDPQEAIRLAQHACRLTNFQQPRFLVVLADAYTAAENFPQAMRIALTALDITRAAGQHDQAADIEARIRHYRAQLPRR